MGEIAARLADVLVVTDDNPRTEDPGAIRAAVLAGTGDAAAEVRRGRRPSARDPRGAARARPGDIVLVAGKGHETGQEVAGVVHPFDDRDVVREELAGRADDPDDPRRDRRRRRRSSSHGDRETRVDAVRRTSTPRVAGARAACSWRSRGSASTATTTPRPAPTPFSASRPTPAADRGGRRPGGRRSAGWRAHVVDRSARPASSALTGSAGQDRHQGLPRRTSSPAPAPTVATAGNLNNEIGVPLTVLRGRRRTTRYLVVEMGARGVGHIAYLCSSRRPRIAAVLNVGTAHLSEFGSRERIALAKGEIVEALPADGVAVLNADDDLVAAMAGAHRGPGRSRSARPATSTWRGGGARRLGRPSFDARTRAARGTRSRSTQSGGPPGRQRAAAAALAIAVGRRRSRTVAAAAVDRASPRAAGGWRCTSAPTGCSSSTTPTTPTPPR